MGRCGSTLLCQIFYRLPKTFVLSDAFAGGILIGSYNKGLMSWEDAKKHMRSIVRLQCKPMHKVRLQVVGYEITFVAERV